MGTSVLDLKNGFDIFRPSRSIPPSPSLSYGRLYNWYAASSRSYGRLYNWYAVSNTHGIAPEGWHVPTQDEFNTLIAFLGGASVAGGKMKETGSTYWKSTNTGATNESGFNALGAAYRPQEWGTQNGGAYFWTSNEAEMDDRGIYLSLSYNSTSISINDASKTCGCSLRFIKEDSNDPGTVKDYEGYEYPTVKIGTQVWTAQNWQSQFYKDGAPISAGLEIDIAYDDMEWINLADGACCWSDDTKTKDIAPAGWHLPTLDEGIALATYLGGTLKSGGTVYTIAGGKIKEAGTSHWTSPNSIIDPVSSFCALPSGHRNNDGSFAHAGTMYVSWTSSIIVSGYANDMALINDSTDLIFIALNGYKYGESIRFIRNINSSVSFAFDTEKHKYNAITIGTQYWMDQSWKSKFWRDGVSIPYAGTNGLYFTDQEWAALTTPGVCAYKNDEPLV
jgi:uncharacterized protein (TIGR02145 family)